MARRKIRKYGRGRKLARRYRGAASGRPAGFRYTAVPMYSRKSDLMGFGIPDAIICKLRYCAEITLDPAASTIAYHTFSANGLYDPDLTGTGHQPYGFDQLMALYNNYEVLSSRVRATPVSTAAADNTPGYLTVMLTAEQSTPGSFTSIEHMLESNLKGKGVYVGGGFANALGGSGNRAMATHNFNAKKYFGALDDDHEGTTAGNPTEQAYFQVCYSSIANNNPTSVTIFVTLDFTAKLTEPKLLAQS